MSRRTPYFLRILVVGEGMFLECHVALGIYKVLVWRSVSTIVYAYQKIFSTLFQSSIAQNDLHRPSVLKVGLRTSGGVHSQKKFIILKYLFLHYLDICSNGVIHAGALVQTKTVTPNYDSRHCILHLRISLIKYKNG